MLCKASILSHWLISLDISVRFHHYFIIFNGSSSYILCHSHNTRRYASIVIFKSSTAITNLYFSILIDTRIPLVMPNPASHSTTSTPPVAQTSDGHPSHFHPPIPSFMRDVSYKDALAAVLQGLNVCPPSASSPSSPLPDVNPAEPSPPAQSGSQMVAQTSTTSTLDPLEEYFDCQAYMEVDAAGADEDLSSDNLSVPTPRLRCSSSSSSKPKQLLVALRQRLRRKSDACTINEKLASGVIADCGVMKSR